MRPHNAFLILGLALLALIPLWLFFILPELTKVPADYSYHASFISNVNLRPEINGEWLGSEIQNTYVDVRPLRWDNKVMLLNEMFRAESVEGEVSYELELKFAVDRNTRKNAEGLGEGLKEGFFLLPMHVEKTSYPIWAFGYYHSAKFSFAGEEDVKGIKTYRFSVVNELSDDTEGFAHLELVPERYNALSEYTSNIWVEPVSGIIVKYEDKGISYYAEKETGKRVWDFDEWSSRFSEDTVANMAGTAGRERQNKIVFELIIPLLLGAIALALFAVAFIGGGRRR